MSYTYLDLSKASQDVGGLGNIDALKQKRALINRSVREVSRDVDLHATRRRTALAPSLYMNEYAYTKPTDLKGLGIIDLAAQINRPLGYRSEWQLVSPGFFDRYKKIKRNLVAVSNSDGVGRILISAPVNDDRAVLNAMDSLTANGTVSASGAANNVRIDHNDYVEGTASIAFDVDTSGVAGGLDITGMTSVDLTDYEGEDIYLKVRIPSAALAKMSNVGLRFGSDTANYYSRTITTTAEGLSFEAGWNTIRLPWDTSVTTTGTPDKAAIDYIRPFITLSSALTTEVVDWNFDYIVARRGIPHTLYYYSKYAWQTSGGTWIENSTVDTDILNAESDEVDLIALRLDYNTLRALKATRALIEEARVAYENARDQYRMSYPSESLVQMESYYDFPSGQDDLNTGDLINHDTN